MKHLRKFSLATLIALALLVTAVGPAFAAQPLPGAIFTTDSTCTGVNLNIYGDKADVYLDGGPAHKGAASLPDDSYYVQVTDPSGATVLGTSVGSGNETPFVVVNGEPASCYQLWNILIKGSDASQGYDDTPNNGGEYKVWVSNEASFTNNSTKTDNFKVKEDGGVYPATLNVIKFYDANANSINDDGQLITGWKVRIQDGIDYIRYTPVSIIVDPDDYTVTEFYPVEPNWMSTTANPVYITLVAGEEETVEFGNYCLVPSGGRTLGFWSNKNGQALVTAANLMFLSDLKLRYANGNNFDPMTKTELKNWLLSATAQNMAYMLSAQLAAMELNVQHGFVDPNAFYVPAGMTIQQIMNAANTSLDLYPNTTAAGPNRTAQETLKNYLDALNNGASVVPPTPCSFTFAE